MRDLSRSFSYSRFIATAWVRGDVLLRRNEAAFVNDELPNVNALHVVPPGGSVWLTNPFRHAQQYT